MEMDIPASNGVVQVLQSVVQQWPGAQSDVREQLIYSLSIEIRNHLQIIWLPLVFMHYL